MAYVYKHSRLDTNEPFYIGISEKQAQYSTIKAEFSRAFCKERKSKEWNRVAKISGFSVEIVLDNVSWAEAAKKEKELIELYGRAHLNAGTLVNIKAGGEGSSDFIMINGNQMQLITKKGPSTAKQIIDTKTGKIYECIKEASESLKVNRNTLAHYLGGHRQNKTSLEYLENINIKKHLIGEDMRYCSPCLGMNIMRFESLIAI